MENKSFKCKSCGANIKKEEKCCSYCGRQNENLVKEERELKQQEQKLQEMIEQVFEGKFPFVNAGLFSFDKTNREN